MKKSMVVNASLLEVRKDVSKKSKIFLNRNTIVNNTGKTKQYKKELWIEIMTVSEPKIVGFVQCKYVKEI